MMGAAISVSMAVLTTSGLNGGFTSAAWPNNTRLQVRKDTPNCKDIHQKDVP